MYGDGSVFEEKRGKYCYYTYRYYDNTGKEVRKRFPHTKQGEREANAFKRKIRREKESGELYAPATMSLGEWIIYYMTNFQKPKVREQTFERLKYTARKLEPIYQYPLDQITSEQVQELYNFYRPTLASATIYKIHKLLAGAFKKALQLKKIKHNPMDAVEPIKVQSKKVTVFSFTELLRIFRVMKQNPAWHRLYIFFYLALVLGCRVGELLALQIEDINFEKREIHICRTKVGRTGQKFNSPKTRAGDRYIPIVFDSTLRKLKALRVDENITRLSGLLFQSRTGTALNYNNIRREWVKICRAAGVGNKTIHTFRHTFATAALARGVPILEVSRILGHADATTTLNMYGHAIPGYNQHLIEKYQTRTKSMTKNSENIDNKRFKAISK